MPYYDFRCQSCGYAFESFSAYSDEMPECPQCESHDVERLITSAPVFARGMLTHAGDTKRATKEQLNDKWAEETPKLRKKLRDKLGDEAVKQIPTLNMSDD